MSLDLFQGKERLLTHKSYLGSQEIFRYLDQLGTASHLPPFL
jgi:hypothetical protein